LFAQFVCFFALLDLAPGCSHFAIITARAFPYGAASVKGARAHPQKV
jgi:hypothetical protein